MERDFIPENLRKLSSGRKRVWNWNVEIPRDVAFGVGFVLLLMVVLGGYAALSNYRALQRQLAADLELLVKFEVMEAEKAAIPARIKREREEIRIRMEAGESYSSIQRDYESRDNRARQTDMAEDIKAIRRNLERQERP